MYPPLPASEETFIHQAVRELETDPDIINKMFEKLSLQIIADMRQKVNLFFGELNVINNPSNTTLSDPHITPLPSPVSHILQVNRSQSRKDSSIAPQRGTSPAAGSFWASPSPQASAASPIRTAPSSPSRTDRSSPMTRVNVSHSVSLMFRNR